MPNPLINCSLIISTYNWVEALELTLNSVLLQSVLPKEVIIADDGSKEETRDLIERYKQTFPVPLIHIWHEDKGFRLASIRNKAFAVSTQEYLIQIDGDVILHPQFIEDHVTLASPNCLLQGSRVNLGKYRSAILLKKKQSRVSVFSTDISRRENGIRWISLAKWLLTKYRNRYPVYYARGANMSFWRKDILAINGYNENFTGWGHEDSDLTLRMLNNHKTKLVLKFSAIVYHLYHPEHTSKTDQSGNKHYIEETLRQKISWTDNGINKYLTENKQT